MSNSACVVYIFLSFKNFTKVISYLPWPPPPTLLQTFLKFSFKFMALFSHGFAFVFTVCCMCVVYIWIKICGFSPIKGIRKMHFKILCQWEHSFFVPLIHINTMLRHQNSTKLLIIDVICVSFWENSASSSPLKKFWEKYVVTI